VNKILPKFRIFSKYYVGRTKGSGHIYCTLKQRYMYEKGYCQ